MNRRLVLLILVAVMLTGGWSCKAAPGPGGGVTQIQLDGSVGTPPCNPSCGDDSHDRG